MRADYMDYQQITLGTLNGPLASFTISSRLASLLESQIAPVSKLNQQPNLSAWPAQSVYYVPLWQLQLMSQEIGYDEPQLGNLCDAILSYYVTAPTATLRFVSTDPTIGVIIAYT